MLRRWLSNVLAIFLALTPAGAQEFSPSAGPQLGYIFPPPEPTTPTMYPAVCQANSAGTNNFAQTLSFPGVDDSWNVEVVVIALGEDTAATFNVTAITFNGIAGAEINDEAGSGAVNSAVYIRSMNNASSVNTVTTYSEGVTSNVVCGWAFAGLASATADSSAVDDDATTGALVLTLGTTNAAGFAVGGCVGAAITETATWAVLTEREDTQHAEADYSNADATATGGSMAVTCTMVGVSGVSSGVAAAFH